VELEEALERIKKAGIVTYKSIRDKYILYIPASSNELPDGLSTKQNIKKQLYGTHYTEFGIIKLAETVTK
jgi:hypothetical protein